MNDARSIEQERIHRQTRATFDTMCINKQATKHSELKAFVHIRSPGFVLGFLG